MARTAAGADDLRVGRHDDRLGVVLLARGAVNETAASGPVGAQREPRFRSRTSAGVATSHLPR